MLLIIEGAWHLHPGRFSMLLWMFFIFFFYLIYLIYLVFFSTFFVNCDFSCLYSGWNDEQNASFPNLEITGWIFLNMRSFL